VIEKEKKQEEKKEKKERTNQREIKSNIQK